MTEYSLELKAKVIADYALGMTKVAISKKHGVPRTTVIAWCQGVEPPATLSDTQQREELGRLVGDYLTTSLQALIAANELAADRAYLKRTDVSFAAVYNTIHAGFMAVAQAVEEGADEGIPLVSGSPGATG